MNYGYGWPVFYCFDVFCDDYWGPNGSPNPDVIDDPNLETYNID